MIRAVLSRCLQSNIHQRVKPHQISSLLFIRSNERRNFSVDQTTKFQECVDNSKKLKNDPGNVMKLTLYGLFKQATEGENTTPKPGALDIIGRYKWDAWSKLGNMSKEEAQKAYIQQVEDLIKDIGLRDSK